MGSAVHRPCAVQRDDGSEEVRHEKGDDRVLIPADDWDHGGNDESEKRVQDFVVPEIGRTKLLISLLLSSHGVALTVFGT